VLDIFLSRGLVADSVHGAARGLLVRVAQMLTRLVRAMER